MQNLKYVSTEKVKETSCHCCFINYPIPVGATARLKDERDGICTLTSFDSNQMMIRYFRNQTFIHIIQLAVSNTFFFYSGVIFYKLLPTTSPQNIPHPVTTQHMQMQLSGTHDDVIDSLAQVCSKYQRTPRCPSLTLITLHQASTPQSTPPLCTMTNGIQHGRQRSTREESSRARAQETATTDRRVPATPSRTNSKHDLAEPKQRCRRFGSRKRAHTHTAQRNAGMPGKDLRKR